MDFYAILELTIATDTLMTANQRNDEESKAYLVFFKNRRTGIAIRAASRSEAISKARAKKKRGSDEIATVRLATAEEKKQAANGSWVRNGPQHQRPGEMTIRGQGPRPKNYKGDSLTPDQLTAFNTALETRKDEIDRWQSQGKSEVYITTRIIEGLRSDGVITEERVDKSVSWKYGSGTATGKVVRRYIKPIELTLQGSKIRRNGTPDDPALLIQQENGARVLKLKSEVR